MLWGHGHWCGTAAMCMSTQGKRMIIDGPSMSDTLGRVSGWAVSARGTLVCAAALRLPCMWPLPEPVLDAGVLDWRCDSGAAAHADTCLSFGQGGASAMS